MKVLIALVLGLTVLGAFADEKPGECPESEEGTVLLNPVTCSTDGQCQGDHKCCNDFCVPPVCDDEESTNGCLLDPCMNATCSLEDARCFVNRCSDDCETVWFLGDEDVSDDCDEDSFEDEDMFDDDDDEDSDADDDDDEIAEIDDDDNDVTTEDQDSVDGNDKFAARKRWRLMSKAERKAWKAERLEKRKQKRTMTREEKIAAKAERKAARKGGKLARKEQKWARKAEKERGPFKNLSPEEKQAMIEERKANLQSKIAQKRAEKMGLFKDMSPEERQAMIAEKKAKRKAKWAEKMEKKKNKGMRKRGKFEKIKARRERKNMKRQINSA